MKNKLNTFVITLASLGLLAACNRNTPAPAPQPGPDEGEGEGEGGETLTALEQEVKGFLEHRGVTGVMVPFIKDVEADKVQDKEVHPDSYTPEGETDEYAPVFKFNVTDPAAYTGYLATLEANNWTVGEYGNYGYECVDPAQKVEVDIDYLTQEDIDQGAAAGYDVSGYYPCTIVNIYAYADLYGEPEEPFVPGEQGYLTAAIAGFIAAQGSEVAAPVFDEIDQKVQDLDVLNEENDQYYAHVLFAFAEEDVDADDVLDIFDATEGWVTPEASDASGIFECVGGDKEISARVFGEEGYTYVYMMKYRDVHPVDLGDKTLTEHVTEFLDGRGVEEFVIPGLEGLTEDVLKAFKVVTEPEADEVANVGFIVYFDFATAFAEAVSEWEQYATEGFLTTDIYFRDVDGKVLVAVSYIDATIASLFYQVDSDISIVNVYAYADYFAVNGDPFPAKEFPADEIAEALAKYEFQDTVPAFTGEATGYEFSASSFMLEIAVADEDAAKTTYIADVLAAEYTENGVDEYGDMHYLSPNGEIDIVFYPGSDVDYEGYLIIVIEPIVPASEEFPLEKLNDFLATYEFGFAFTAEQAEGFTGTSFVADDGDYYGYHYIKITVDGDVSTAYANVIGPVVEGAGYERDGEDFFWSNEVDHQIYFNVAEDGSSTVIVFME